MAFYYDENANLLGEYDNSGSTEHIYLNGIPVGVVKNTVLYYVHTDQIGTPRSITNNANTVVWKWDNAEPFGSNLPSVNSIEYNKRFAGQIFDNESKLHYNYYRTYNPLTGRYIQSDPLGLAAGFNTYAYVTGNPLGSTDKLGLDTIDMGLQTSGDTLINAGFYIEAMKKIKNDNNPYTLTLLSHGSINTLNGNSPNELFNQIAKGIFETRSGYVKNYYFSIMIEKGTPIHIVLDACNTGITPYEYNHKVSGISYVATLANLIKKYLNKYGYQNQVIIEAPNGLADGKLGFLSDLQLKDTVEPSSRGDGILTKGGWIKEIR